MVNGSLRAYVALGLVAFVGAALACNSVLGIDPPTLVIGAGPDGGGSSASACGDYCATMKKNCTGAFQEYLNVPTCVAMCQTFEPGTPGDTTQDSLSCRTHFANLSASDPAANCRSAGPLGESSCGNAPCTAFCALVQSLCTAVNPPISPPYSSAIACVSACQSNFVYLLDAGDIALSAGDTLNCRAYHLESGYAPSSNPKELKANLDHHCPHTGVISATCFNAAPADAGPPASDAGNGGG